MPTLADARKILPALDGLDDERAFEYIHERHYPGYDKKDLADRLGYKLKPPPVPPTPSRSILTAANDTVIEGANAFLSGVQGVGNFFSPGNRFSGMVGELIKEGEDKQSEPVRAEKQRYQQEVEAADGLMGEVLPTLGYVARNPVIGMAQALGSVAGPGLLVKGLSKGAQAVGLAEKAASRVGLAGGSALGGAMAGGDAAGTAYDLVAQTPISTLAQTPEFQALAEQGMDTLSIVEALAGNAARKASVLPGIAGAASGAVGLERLFAGGKGFAGGALKRGIKTGVVEAVPEAFEEGLTTYEGRAAAAQLNPSIDPQKGVGAAATMGGVLGFASGGAIGAISPPGEDGLSAPIPSAGDLIRQNLQPETGALSRATNAGIESQARAADAGLLPQSEPEPTQPLPAPVDDPVETHIHSLPDDVKVDAIRAYGVIGRDDVSKGVLKYNKDLLDGILKKYPQPSSAAEPAPASTATPTPEPVAEVESPQAPALEVQQNTQQALAEEGGLAINGAANAEGFAAELPPEDRPQTQADPRYVNPETGEMKSAFDVRQADAPRQMEGDVLSATGQPFSNLTGARKAAASLGDGFRPFKLSAGAFVVRKDSDVSTTAPVGAVDTGLAGPTNPEPAGGDGAGAPLAADRADGVLPTASAPGASSEPGVAVGTAVTGDSLTKGETNGTQADQAQQAETQRPEAPAAVEPPTGPVSDQAVLLSRGSDNDPAKRYYKKMREILRRHEDGGDPAAFDAEVAEAKAEFDAARASAPMQLDTLASGRQVPLAIRVRKALISARQKFAGTQVTNASDGLAIDIPASGLKHAMSGQVSEAALAALDKVDELVRTAKFSHATPDKKGRNTIKEVRFYDREAVLDGKPVNLRVVVRVAPDGRRYYDHFEIKEKAPAGLSGKRNESDSAQPFTEASSPQILTNPEPNVNAPKKGDPPLKRDQPRNEAGQFVGGIISKAELDEALDVLRKGGLTRVQVAETENDLPESGRLRIKSEGIKGVRGLYDPASDTAWLVRENIADMSEAYGVALHEMFHRGFRKTFGKDVEPLLNQIYWGNQQVRQMTKTYMDKLNIGRIEAVEEVLADLASSGRFRDTKGWDALVAFIKDFLLKLASQFKVQVTFTDKMITDLIAGATQAGKDNGVKLTTDLGSLGAAFSRTTTITPKAALDEAMNRTGGALANRLDLALNLLTRRQIVDVYEKDIPQLKTYSTLVQQMDADKNEVGAQADQLADRWGKLRDEKPLAELMHDATLARTDPDLPFVERAEEKPLERRARLVEHKVLVDRFTALSDDAKAVYRETRDAYRVQYDNIKQAIRENIERAIKDEPTKLKFLDRLDTEFFKDIRGVYFPLARFGEYLVNVRDADGGLISHHRAETLNEANHLRAQLVEQGKTLGWDVGKVLKSKEFNARRDLAGKGFIKEIMDTLKTSGVDGNVIDSVAQLYLQSLPDLSWAKHGIHRKGTPGFSQDARRAFASNMFFGARYLAKLRYNDKLLDSLATMQEQVDSGAYNDGYDSVAAQKVVDHMNKRHDSLMNPDTNPLSTALTSIGFIFHLGLSPASAMVNLSQTALVAYPIMGAKWGYAKASAALLSASKLVTVSKNDLSNALTGDEKAAYEQAVKDGTIDVTQAHDLAGIAQGEDSKVAWKIRPVMKWASFLFHHAERFNRQVTFVASYRLAREAGAAHEQAVDEATKATIDGHFDYSASNRAKAMQGNVARVVLLFKQYAQNMIYTLSRQAFLAMKGQTPEERIEARKALGGLLAMHAAAAGGLGLPIVSTLLAAASFLGGDDDEPWNAEVALKNTLADTFGPKAAEVMAHGLSRLTPWDISGRVGLDKLLFPDIQEGLDGGRWFESAATAALGPVVGIGLNALKGLQDVSEGRTVRGLEGMMPTALRGPLKAYRYATEGNVDRTGVVINDEVSLSGIAGQAAGFSPSETRAAQEVRSAIYSHDNALVERRKSLMNQYAMAKMAGDEEGAQEVREMINGFNEKNPARRIKPVQLVQSVRRRQQRIDSAEDGVYLPKNRRDAIGAVRFGEEATAE